MKTYPEKWKYRRTPTTTASFQIISLQDLVRRERFVRVNGEKLPVKVEEMFTIFVFVFVFLVFNESIQTLGDSGSGFYIDVRSTWTVLGVVSSATVQECGSNDFVLFTNVVKFTDWIKSEISKTNDNDELESVFNEFDENPNDFENPIERKNVVDTECKYQESR